MSVSKDYTFELKFDILPGISVCVLVVGFESSMGCT